MSADTQTPVEDLEGRELDAAVAREVFGLDVRGPEEHRGYWIHGESPFAYQFRSTDGDRGGDINGVPYFSEDWGPAGRVWEEICDSRFVSLHHWPRNDEYAVRINGEVAGKADTAPLAICRAALRAVRGEE